MINEYSLSSVKENYKICKFCGKKCLINNDKKNFENHICDFRYFYSDVYPIWINECHGIKQLMINQSFLRKFFWIILLIFCVGGTFLAVAFVIKDYKKGETITFTSLKIVQSLELPALTICPDVHNILNTNGIYNEVQSFYPNVTINEVKDLIQYFLAGNGYIKMKRIKYSPRNYIEHIGMLYNEWSKNYTNYDFYFHVQNKYGFKCEEIFVKCIYNKKTVNCCKDIFKPIPVLGRGICYQNIKGLKQEDEDELGKLILKIKAPFINKTNNLKNKQTQLIAFVDSNFDLLTSGHPLYILPNVYNILYIKAKKIKLIEKNENCLNKIEGNNNICFVRNFLNSRVIETHHCIFSYLKHLYLGENYPICNLSTIISLYNRKLFNKKLKFKPKVKCLPGCYRWQYFTTLLTGNDLTHFSGYHFNLEMSFMNLQYEQIIESYTTSIPAFIAEIGGQFGFFLGISVITLLQIIIYLYNKFIMLINVNNSDNIHD
ncbi:Na+ channel, amiloride-sensitive family-containing protein [Strongyloides ratti]|uniref:Na+ channel, amiloride-sensitive family-containing protein n=1 Tax=Strongyloides ratti TaxID=34506 RepID=A0A090LG95_STRRB|nr:Na+ channel, amiloride-sensitive family-containing protein [Strongyloides ratti]CEF68767.1 Na+ channel, amiloride-sensitive family-containing protein [Strongyloides ratti]